MAQSDVHHHLDMDIMDLVIDPMMDLGMDLEMDLAKSRVIDLAVGLVGRLEEEVADREAVDRATIIRDGLDGE